MEILEIISLDPNLVELDVKLFWNSKPPWLRLGTRNLQLMPQCTNHSINQKIAPILFRFLYSNIQVFLFLFLNAALTFRFRPLHFTPSESLSLCVIPSRWLELLCPLHHPFDGQWNKFQSNWCPSFSSVAPLKMGISSTYKRPKLIPDPTQKWKLWISPSLLYLSVSHIVHTIQQLQRTALIWRSLLLMIRGQIVLILRMRGRQKSASN